MKLTIPKELQNNFDMLMKSVPEALQGDEQLKDTALVYLKLGGMSLARNYIATAKKYLNNDPLETGIGVRFPKIVEPRADDDKPDETDESDEDEDEDDQGEDEDEDEDSLIDDDI
jgi:hypothetical protein